MNVLVVDNFDSFTFNLVHLLDDIGADGVTVWRNNVCSMDDLDDFDAIVLSPGPGIPREAGALLDVVRVCAKTKPMLGVCLGHQAIAEAFGATLLNLSVVHHGKEEPIHIVHENRLFRGLPDQFDVGRYHSWVVDRSTLASEFVVTAVCDEDHVMAFEHMSHRLFGVQFHPESIMTKHGRAILSRFLEIAR